MAKDFKKENFNKGKTFLKSLVTMDESWVHYYTIESKQVSMQWLPKSGHGPRKVKVTNSVKKEMLITFFDTEGMIYLHYVPHGKTVDSEYYVEVLRKFFVPPGAKKAKEEN